MPGTTVELTLIDELWEQGQIVSTDVGEKLRLCGEGQKIWLAAR